MRAGKDMPCSCSDPSPPQGTPPSGLTAKAVLCVHRAAIASYADVDMSDATAPSSAEQHAAMAWALLGPNHRGNITFEAIKPDEGDEEGGEGASGGEAGSGEGGSTSPKAQQVATLTTPLPLSSSLRFAQTLLSVLALPPPPHPLPPHVPPPVFFNPHYPPSPPPYTYKHGPLLYAPTQST